MNFELIKNERLSGRMASVYEVFLEGEPDSIFDQFLATYKGTHREQVISILDRLESIGHDYGARPDFFKEKEGKYGDLVEVLYDTPKKSLRLFCMRFGRDCVILGGGGPKPPGTRAWQDNANLNYQGNLMIQVAEMVHKAFKDGEWKWTADFKDMKGALEFKTDEDE